MGAVAMREDRWRLCGPIHIDQLAPLSLSLPTFHQPSIMPGTAVAQPDADSGTDSTGKDFVLVSADGVAFWIKWCYLYMAR